MQYSLSFILRDALSIAFWTVGQVVHHSTNGYQAACRYHRDRIASGTLRADFCTVLNEAQEGLDLTVEACDQALDEWQLLSDAFRGLLWAILAPVLALLWGAACDLSLVAARLFGRVWGYWMSQALVELPILAALAVFVAQRYYSAARQWLRSVAAQLVSGCDRALTLAFALG